MPSLLAWNSVFLLFVVNDVSDLKLPRLLTDGLTGRPGWAVCRVVSLTGAVEHKPAPACPPLGVDPPRVTPGQTQNKHDQQSLGEAL